MLAKLEDLAIIGPLSLEDAACIVERMGWEAAIIDYAKKDSSERDAQLTRLQSYRSPDWSSHFAAVEDWLRLLGGATETDKDRLDQRSYS
jgi:hypothetical protein